MSNSRVKAALEQTIAGIQADPKKAQAIFRANTEWVDGVLTKVQARQFTFAVDEPAALGGTDIAPNPVEFLLASLGTCQEIIIAAFAAIQGIPITSIKVDVKGPLDLHGFFGLKEGVPPGFRKISYETTIESPAEEEVIRQLIAASEKHCPVLDTLVNQVEVTGTLNVVRTPVEAIA